MYNNSNDNLIDERRLKQLEDYNNRINTDKIQDDIINELTKYKEIL